MESVKIPHTKYKNFSLKEAWKIFEIPNPTGHEIYIKNYIKKWCNKHGISTFEDKIGNLYLTKGECNYYPCLTAHLDCIQPRQTNYISNDSYSKLPIYKNKSFIRCLDDIGVGGDNKVGIVAALSIIQKFDNIKIAFFVDEESGMKGSQKLYKPFFDDVGYVISFDANGENIVSYECHDKKLFSKKFYNIIKDILFENGYNIIKTAPSDIANIVRKVKIQGIMLSGGFLHEHKSDEYINLLVLDKAIGTAVQLIERLGCQRYKLPSRKSYFGDVFLYERYLSMKSLSLTAAKLDLIKEFNISADKIIDTIQTKCEELNIDSSIFNEAFDEVNKYKQTINDVISRIR